MHSSSLRSLLTRLGPAVGFGLLTTTISLAWSVVLHPPSLNPSPDMVSRPDSDRGSGRFSRSAFDNAHSFRGSGRIDSAPWMQRSDSPQAYRGSGRIAQGNQA
jgi:hypothetical protein